MIGLSRTGTQELRAHGLVFAQPMTADQSRVSPAVVTAGESIGALAEVPLADLRNPALTFTVACEVSPDGVNWQHWGGFSYTGSANRTASQQPQARISPAPVGWRVRTIVRAVTAMTAGARLVLT